MATIPSTVLYPKDSVDTLIAAAKARGNHTGTQPASTIVDFAEAVEDAVAAILGRSTNVGITWVYNDAAGTLQATVSGGGSGGIDAETARDAVNAQFVGTGGVNISVNDASDTVTFTLSGVTISQITGLQAALDGKQAQDPDLQAIADQGTTSYGRSLLLLASLAALQGAVGASTVYAWDYDYTAGAWPTPPASAPSGTKLVIATGPTQPPSPPSWMGIGVGKIYAIYNATPG